MLSDLVTTFAVHVSGLTSQDLLAADDAERGRIVLPLEHASKVAVKRVPDCFVRAHGEKSDVMNLPPLARRNVCMRGWAMTRTRQPRWSFKADAGSVANYARTRVFITC